MKKTPGMRKSSSAKSGKGIQIVAHILGGVCSHITVHGKKVKIEAFIMDHDDAKHEPIEESLRRNLTPLGSTKYEKSSAEDHIRAIYRDDYQYTEPQPETGKRRK